MIERILAMYPEVTMDILEDVIYEYVQHCYNDSFSIPFNFHCNHKQNKCSKLQTVQN